jgi:hypothetical protein
MEILSYDKHIKLNKAFLQYSMHLKAKENTVYILDRCTTIEWFWSELFFSDKIVILDENSSPGYVILNDKPHEYSHYNNCILLRPTHWSDDSLSLLLYANRNTNESLWISFNSNNWIACK